MKKNFLLILLALSTVSISAFSQNEKAYSEFTKWSFMLKGGITRGQYTSHGVFNDYDVYTPVVGIEIERTFNPLWGIALDVQGFTFAGGHYIPWQPAHNSEGYSLRTDGDAIEGSLMLAVNLSNLLAKDRSEAWRKFNAYFRIGGGLTRYRTNQLGVMEEFRSDVQGENAQNYINAGNPQDPERWQTDKDNNYKKDYVRHTFVLPTELQLEYNVSKPLALGLILGRRWHSTDHMGFPDLPQFVEDGKVVTYKEAIEERVSFWSAELSLRFKFLSTGDYKHIRNWVPELKEEPTLVKAYDDTPLRDRLDAVERALQDHDDIIRQLLNNDVNFSEDNLLIIPIVEFDVDKYDIKGNYSYDLDVLAQALAKQTSQFVIYISGHTDNTGSHEHNVELSKNRAEAVKRYLESRGVRYEMKATGYAENSPIDTNATAEGRQRNRRVEIRFGNK